MKSLTLQDINEQINNTFCEDTIFSLSDENLLEDYLNCNSVRKKVSQLENLLEKYDVNCKKYIVDEYILNLIPPGTKGVIKGNKFNNIVRNYLSCIDFPEEIELKFEEKCKEFETDEIPDWYILNNKNKKIIIGMNQLDLWNGGHQLNRGYKYINSDFGNDVKLVSVVANYTQLKGYDNKIYKIFDTGFRRNNLCYLKNLESIINKFIF